MIEENSDEMFGFPIMRFAEANEFSGFVCRKAKSIEVDAVMKEEIDFHILELRGIDENISEEDLKTKCIEFARLQRQEIMDTNRVLEFKAYDKTIFAFSKIKITEVEEHNHIEVTNSYYMIKSDMTALLKGDNYLQICLGTN